MTDYRFDEERTIDAMAYSSNVDLMRGLVTLFAVVCIGDGVEPHYSHGGILTDNAQEAIDIAREQNEDARGCRYLPAAVGIHPASLLHLAQLVMSGGMEEPGGGELD